TTGATDPDPASIFVFYDPPLAAPTPEVTVNQSEIDVRWTDTNPTNAVAGYSVENEQQRELVSESFTKSATSSSTSSGDPNSPLNFGFWASDTGFPQQWETTFSQPVLVSSL